MVRWEQRVAWCRCSGTKCSCMYGELAGFYQLSGHRRNAGFNARGSEMADTLECHGRRYLCVCCASVKGLWGERVFADCGLGYIVWILGFVLFVRCSVAKFFLLLPENIRLNQEVPWRRTGPWTVQVSVVSTFMWWKEPLWPPSWDVI